MKKLSNKGFAAAEALLVVLIVGIVGFIGWYVYQAKQNTDKILTANSSTTPVFKKKTTTTSSTTQSADTSNQDYVTVKEWGIKLVLNTGIASKNVSYTFSPATDTNGSIDIKNTEDPLVKICNSSTITITQESKAQALYLAPGTIPSYSADDTNYGAKYVINGSYYFLSGPQQACNGDYNIFTDPQHNIIKSIQVL